MKEAKEKSAIVLNKQRRIRMLMIFCGSVMIWVFELYSFIFLDILKYYKFRPYLAVLYSICTFLFFKGVVYFVLNKPEFFAKPKKYVSSRLTVKEKKLYHEKLMRFVNEEKPYLNSLLTLTDLATAISVPHRDLSQIINEMYQQNFYDFINKFRIDECKKILRETSGEKLTVLEAGYSVGFNSKSAFNNAFKKNTGMTPIKYRNKFHSESQTTN
jgi:AraC-like DNA-binding protein